MLLALVRESQDLVTIIHVLLAIDGAALWMDVYQCFEALLVRLSQIHLFQIGAETQAFLLMAGLE
jgi:hypothetical protein